MVCRGITAPVDEFSDSLRVTSGQCALPTGQGQPSSTRWIVPALDKMAQLGGPTANTHAAAADRRRGEIG